MRRFELLMQALDRVRGADRLPLARREAGEGEQPVAGLLQAVGDGAAFQLLLADEGFAPSFDLGPRRGVDHVAIVVGDFIVQPLGRVSKEIAVLVNRATLDQRIGPQL
jgi:hypothetical protein